MTRADTLVRGYARSLHLAGLAFFAVDALVYALALFGTVVAPQWWLKGLCSVVAGFCTSGLLIVAHDACHQSLTPNRWLNRVIGTLAFLPALHAWSLWRHGHNFLHHLHTNQRGLDYAWEPLTPREFANLSAWSRWRYQFYRTMAGHFFYYPVEVWWWRRFIPHRLHLGEVRLAHWLDSGIVMAWLLILSAGLITGHSCATGVAIGEIREWPWVLGLGIGFPFLISGMLQSHSTFLHHTHPEIPWFGKDARLDWQRQLETAVHVEFPAPVDWFLHWIMDHPAHHLLPPIPLYQLSSAEKLLEDRAAARIVSYRFSLRALCEILGACKLYDLEARCWTDYEGRPTSKAVSVFPVKRRAA